MNELENDRATAGRYLNPIFLMAHSGARGGVEQIRQLAGMRGLMAKPSRPDHRDADQGQLPRGPDRAGVLQLHPRRPQGPGRHGPQDGRLRLPDPQAGRRGPERGHHACTTAAPPRASPRASIYKGEEVERAAWPTSIRGRVSRDNIVNPHHRRGHRPRERDDHRGQSPARSRTWASRRSASAAPMTCEARWASAGCATAWTWLDRHPGRGRHGRRHHRRPVHRRAGHAAHHAHLPHRRRRRRGTSRRATSRAKKAGTVKFTTPEGRAQRPGEHASRSPATARSSSWTPRTASWRSYKVPAGSTCWSEEPARKCPGHGALQVGPAHHAHPGRSRRQGPLRGHRRGRDAAHGKGRRRHEPPPGHGAQGRPAPADRAGRRPAARSCDFYYLPEQALIEVDEGTQRSPPARCWPRRLREVSGTQDITGGLPRVTEIFEARKPRDPVGDRRDRRHRGAVGRETPRQADDHRPQRGRHRARAPGAATANTSASTPAISSTPAKPLVDGPLVPHDILRISGEEEVQRYLVREIQNVYRSQRVEINDKHLEIIVAQMLRKVRVESGGDTGLLEGSVMDKFEFRARTRNWPTA